MKIGIYPGCSLSGGSREYLESVQALAAAFDIELTEIPDWNCCGATAAHALNHNLSLSLPARNLALAEKEGITHLLVPCAACYNRLSVTRHELGSDIRLSREISDQIGLPLEGNLEVMNIIQFIDRFISDRLPGKVVRPFQYRSACYYGCLLVRPHKVLQFDRPEDPLSMDNLISLSGGEPLEWPFKTECCGAGLSVSRTDTVARLSGRILKDATDRGAETMVVACPMCHSNLDLRRPEINRFQQTDIDVPVLYITQVLGLAIGLDTESLGINRHMVKVKLPVKPVKEEE